MLVLLNVTASYKNWKLNFNTTLHLFNAIICSSPFFLTVLRILSFFGNSSNLIRTQIIKTSFRDTQARIVKTERENKAVWRRKTQGKTRLFGEEKLMGLSIFKLFVAVALVVLSIQVVISQQLGDGNFISWEDLAMENTGQLQLSNRGDQYRVITVAQDGTGDSKTVQGAVDLVEDGNKQRAVIIILPGIYRERVLVPITKPHVSFIGNQSSQTVISWHSRASDKSSNGQILGTFASASVAIEADYFCARGITFENTSPNPSPGAKGMQAVALRVSGDKAMFFRCRILGTQDTLFDEQGRHYFLQCYIQGSIDFIFGNARSLYQGCTLHAIASSYGAIAASQRNSENDDSGFSFLKCTITGSGMLYLGRAWGRYARVVYSYCNLDNIIIPQGWYDWGDPSRRGTVLFAEYECSGGGADSTERVGWEKSLTYDEVEPFLSKNYIDGDQWLRL